MEPGKTKLCAATMPNQGFEFQINMEYNPWTTREWGHQEHFPLKKLVQSCCAPTLVLDYECDAHVRIKGSKNFCCGFYNMFVTDKMHCIKCPWKFLSQLVINLLLFLRTQSFHGQSFYNSPCSENHVNKNPVFWHHCLGSAHKIVFHFYWSKDKYI